MSRIIGRVTRKIDPSAIRWIVNYQQADKIRESFNLGEMMSNEQIANKLDRHSGGSMRWTKQQSKFIDKHGWDQWLKSDGALGYSYFLKKS